MPITLSDADQAKIMGVMANLAAADETLEKMKQSILRKDIELYARIRALDRVKSLLKKRKVAGSLSEEEGLELDLIYKTYPHLWETQMLRSS